RRGGSTGPPGALALPLELCDLGRQLERERDIVEPVEQAVADLVIDLEGDVAPGEADLLLEQVDLAGAGVGQAAAVLGVEHDRQQPDLGAVGVEDVGEARRHDRPEAVVLQAPGSVLARGAAAEVLPGDEDRVGRQPPPRLLGPVVEEELAEARALDALEELLGHDLVGVDVGAVEEADRPCDDAYRIHQLQLLMSTKWPSIAAAAAICGETRWVRPPRPWRPSKLRFEVEAQRSPGARMSGFTPRHIEHPATRQSKPASRNTRSRPSASACALTCWEPGTTIASTLGATLRPAMTSARARCRLPSAPSRGWSPKSPAGRSRSRRSRSRDRTRRPRRCAADATARSPSPGP